MIVPITIQWLFLIGAIVAAIVSAMGKCQLWVATILLCVVVAIGIIPVK